MGVVGTDKNSVGERIDEKRIMYKPEQIQSILYEYGNLSPDQAFWRPIECPGQSGTRS